MLWEPGLLPTPGPSRLITQLMPLISVVCCVFKRVPGLSFLPLTSG